MRHFTCTLAYILLCVVSSYGWQTADTSSVLGLADVIGWVEAFHPVARQARLSVEEARLGMRQARGAFDP